MPSRTSGIAKRVPSAAMRRSQDAASSSPAPITAPCNWATTGTGSRRIASQARWIRMMKSRALRGSSAAISLTSAPPQNALPRPASTTTRRLSSPANADREAASASSSAESRALTFCGRLRKMRATPPSRTSSTMLSSYSRDALKKVSTATLTTALFKRGLRNVFIQGVFLLNRNSPRMVGEAFTLRYIPAREDIDLLGAFEGRGHPQREAIEACPPGQVLVMDARRDASAATGGDILMTRLMVRGVAGAGAAGGLRESPTLEKDPRPADCRGPPGPAHIWR